MLKVLIFLAEFNSDDAVSQVCLEQIDYLSLAHFYDIFSHLNMSIDCLKVQIDCLHELAYLDLQL